MSQVLTVSCKLMVTPQQVEKLDVVLAVFASCCEFVNDKTPEKLTNQKAVQSLIYKEARAHSGLSAQMTIHAIRRVCANRKVAKQKGRPVKNFAPTSATYDVRTFTFKEADWMVSLTMLKGREKFNLHIGDYQKRLLQGQTPKSATLVKRNDGSFYLNIQLESEPPAIPDPDDVLGIDLGRTDLVCTSKGEKFSGQQITQTRDRYSRVRASLQHKASKGTRSTRRRCRQVLQRLSGRERRFQTWLNHTISYRLTRTAKASNQAIALEDLTGIRERTNELPRSKTERRRSNSWAFYQLRQFLTYKGVKFGVDIRIVDPRYTSKTCHCCKVIGNRQGKKFECLNLKCGWVGDADENGANNIATLGVIVNNPRGSEVMSCSLQDVILRATKSPHRTAIAVGVG
ncbi:transposase [Oscillatoria sp. HE19RPO]|uniref:RNA-guided endonuclease InsQ/TnpB family protein n=1 Tax=Oscillatoria sp. HE19RPO TaxID=2954806 RepID=UPI0020C300D5|nr:transposase [Oscillatoria sp. HE19RPO]